MKSFAWLLKNRPPIARQSGWICFQIGLLFLPSSAFVSGCFFLMALVIGFFKRQESYWSDYWNYPLLVIGLLLCIGSINAFSGWLAWVGLANWIPFFLCFWGFQPYLLSMQMRKTSSLLLLVGTLPVLITGFGQMFLRWEGPWQIFDGLIVWFISPGGSPFGRFSGLFDYANIAGSWLAIVWPFSLAFLLDSYLKAC